VTAKLSDEPAAGIHRIAVETPFAVGLINCYLLVGEPLTLVDTGPNSGSALDHLERGLAELGVRVEELELIVLTHQHMDHEGLTEILARRSGAEVAAFAPLAPWLTDYRASAKLDDQYAQAVMLRHGLRPDIVALLGVLSAGMHSYGSRAVVTRPLQDGATLTMGGREFGVHHRPGHSPSDLVFLDSATGVLIGGDHLIGHISSNALITRPLAGFASGLDSGLRPTPLLDYARSLEATRELGVSRVLPGHGDVVEDPAGLIDRRLADQARRARRILELLGGRSLTAHEIAGEMWGEVAIKQAYLTISEVLGHLDILLAAGAVVERDDDGVSRFTVR